MAVNSPLTLMVHQFVVDKPALSQAVLYLLTIYWSW